jgi:hypothetical protein
LLVVVAIQAVEEATDLDYANVPSRQVEILKDIYYICLGVKSNSHQYLHPSKAHTTIGAAIFYGPKNQMLQCKGRSLKSKESGEMVADHVYSRNQSGKFFIEHDFNDFESFFDWYWNKASIFVWVTKAENRQLKPYQSTSYSEDWRETYRKAGVQVLGDEEGFQSRSTVDVSEAPDA